MSLKRKLPTETGWTVKKERFTLSEIDSNHEDTIEFDLPTTLKEEIDPLSADIETPSGDGDSFFEAQRVKDEDDEEVQSDVVVVDSLEDESTPSPVIRSEISAPLGDSVIQTGAPLTRLFTVKVNVDDGVGLAVINLKDEDVSVNTKQEVVRSGAGSDPEKIVTLQAPPGACSVGSILGPTRRNDKDDSCQVSSGQELSIPQGSFSLNGWELSGPHGLELSDTAHREYPPRRQPPSAALATDKNPKEPEESRADVFALVSVKNILDHPLDSGFWTTDQENAILSQPAPLSNSDLSTTYHPEHIYFAEMDFSQFPWLCDSPEHKRFYCWPCLLVGNGDTLWSVDMTPSLTTESSNYFEEAFKDHQVTPQHLSSLTDLESRKALITPFMVQRNLQQIVALWRDIVRTVCLERKANDKFTLGNDSVLSARILSMFSSLSLRSISPTSAVQITRRILEFTPRYFKSKIIKDVNNSQHVALHIEDLSPFVENRSWVIVIVRYTDQNGRAQEKVVDIVRINRMAKFPRNNDAAMRWLKHVFIDLGFRENVVGFSHSASLVAPKFLSKFHNDVTWHCSRAMFYQPPGQHLFESLFQAMSHLPDGRRYFRDVADLCHFLNTNPLILQYKSAKPASLPKKFDLNLARSLKVHYSALLTIFLRAVSWGDGGFLSSESKRFVKFLQGPKERIMIVLVGLICSICAEFASAVERSMDAELLTELRVKTVKALKKIQGQGLRSINGTADDPGLAKVVYELIPKYVDMFQNVIQLCVDFLMEGFENLEHLLYTRPELLRCTLGSTKYPIRSPDLIARAKLSGIESDQLTLLAVTPHPPEFIQTLDHTQLLQYLAAHDPASEYSGLSRFLRFVNVLSYGAINRKMLAPVCKFISKCLADGVTPNYFSGFWDVGDDALSFVMEDEQFFIEALKSSMLQVVADSGGGVKVVEIIS